MTNNTKLFLERVVVKCNSKEVYNEEFHSGLNVIRGHNGTGKSTIMELISYGLGGDIKKNNWKNEALDCTEIILALKANGSDYVLKRAIEGEGNRPPISIFEGGYENSFNFDSKWEVFKNSKSDERKSYSMQIFGLLGLQQHNTADSESLTMHQFLRVLYVDQDTPASKIFRTEPFTYDKDSMRRAIGEYAFGFDDLESHALRQKLYVAEKEFEKADGELKTIYRVLGKVGTRFSTNEIESEIKELIKELNQGYEELNKGAVADGNSTKLIQNKLADLRKEIGSNSKEIKELEQEYIALEYDISESLDFISTLEVRKSSLNKAGVVSDAIGDIEFLHCPSCFAVVDYSKEDDGSCVLCNSNEGSFINTSYMQALNVIDFQLIETNKVLREQRDSKVILEAEISKIKQKSEVLRAEYNTSSVITNDFQEQLSVISERKGFIQAQMQELNEKLKLTKELDGKISAKQRLQNEINRLSDELTKVEAKRIGRVSAVKSAISKKVVDILSRDGGIETAFDNAESFEFDFASDSFRLDGRANFSASSNVVLKNAFHLASLLVAVTDQDFRIPCFTMFDNIEDKGMTQERSQNFQLILKELCGEIESQYQVIMTTSMVDPLLNNEEFGVGPYYDKGEHTLNF